MIALIKPQFEAGREAVGKNGIVRDPQTHQKVLEDILSFAAQGGYDVLELSYSPITGRRKYRVLGSLEESTRKRNNQFSY